MNEKEKAVKDLEGVGRAGEFGAISCPFLFFAFFLVYLSVTALDTSSGPRWPFSRQGFFLDAHRERERERKREGSRYVYR